MTTIDELAHAQSANGSDPLSPGEQLTALLDLPPRASILGARLAGQGSRASVEIDLANGDCMIFDTLRDMTRAGNLVAEVAACAGIVVSLKQLQLARAVVLVRALAERQETISDNGAAIDWGISYLQTAQVIDLDMNDQAERWAAFALLQEREGAAERHNDASLEHSENSYAALTTYLRHTDGTAYVRCGWFYHYARRLDSGLSQEKVGKRMARVGWTKRGKYGRIKASRPGFDDTLAWNFYTVPSGWEQAQ